jgi:hypothetical protein
VVVADRRCGGCGAAVGPLADRCPVCGADPDVRLIELGAKTGRRRGPGPAATPPGRGAGGLRRWWPVGAALAGAWLAFVVANGSGEPGGGAAPDVTIEEREKAADERDERDSEGPTSTTRPRQSVGNSTSTTVPAVLPGAPLAGEPTGWVVALRADQRSVLIDLDSGEVRQLDAEPVAAVTGGLIVRHGIGIELWPAPFDGSGARSLGGADVGDVLPAGDAGVWMFEYLGNSETQVVRLVGLDGAVRLEDELPPRVWGVGVLDGRLVVQASGGTYLLDLDGSFRRLSVGTPMWVGPDRVYVEECGDRLRCEMVEIGPDGEILDAGELPDFPFGTLAVVSPDGQVAWIDYSAAGLVRLGARELQVGGDVHAMGFSPDSRWLVVATGDGRVRLVDTTTDAEPIVIDPGGFTQPYQVFVFARA